MAANVTILNNETRLSSWFHAERAQQRDKFLYDLSLTYTRGRVDTLRIGVAKMWYWGSFLPESAANSLIDICVRFGCFMFARDRGDGGNDSDGPICPP